MSDEEKDLWPAGFPAWIKIGVVYQRSSRRLAAKLRPLGLTVAQFDLLANLFVDDGMSQQQVAKRLLVTKGNVTGLVNRLADAGLVVRKPDPSDRRAHRLSLTRRGRTRAREALEVQRAMVTELTDALGDDAEELRKLLDRLLARLDAAD